MDQAAIQLELTRRQFPEGIITTDAFQGVIDASMREMQRAEPLLGFASFSTVEQVTDYYVFSPTDPTTRVPDGQGGFNALCQNALSVDDVYWNPGGDWSSLNLFSPGWQMLSQMVLFTGSYFHQPSQITILRQKLDTWKRQFGDQGFEVIGEVGDPSAFIRIYPIPEEAGATVFVQFAASYTVMQIGAAWSKNFMMFVEFHYAEALANYYSQTSGVDILGFNNSQDALKYWTGKAKDKWERIQAVIFGPHGEVARY